ncbi:MAG TPA: HAMP domain-containing sensor histidine kinase [Mycobacteriales bacterium]|nr:HAMP domain-containing sensor histidine kinase [Mycobacteriales bacterium]
MSEPRGPGRLVRWGTAARLAAFVAVMLAAIIGVALFGLLRTFRAQSDASTTRSLVLELQAFRDAAGLRPAGQTLSAFSESYLRTRVLPSGESLAVLLPTGSLIGSAGSAPLLSSPTVTAWAGTPPSKGLSRQLVAGHTSYLVTAIPLITGDTPVATVVAAADLERVHEDLGRVRDLAIGEAAIALAAAVAGSYLMLRRLLGRVGRITDTASDIAAGALDRRLHDPNDTDEVGRLAATFDVMADKLSAAMAAQRRLLSDVSHQLRTPLTVARGHLEVLDRTGAENPAAVRETVDLVVDEIDHMKALVEQLLMLGHALEPDFLSLEPVDLRSFCRELVDSTRVIATRQWELSDVPDVVLQVDAAKLRGALLNLIDNAVRATRDGDVVAIAVDRDVTGQTTLSVDDSGPGIPPDRRKLVLGRFARPGAADSEGSGLGLAIAQAVARAHGGELVIGESPQGGCRVSIMLPPTVTVEVTGDAPDPSEPQCVS